MPDPKAAGACSTPLGWEGGGEDRRRRMTLGGIGQGRRRHDQASVGDLRRPRAGSPFFGGRPDVV